MAIFGFFWILIWLLMWLLPMIVSANLARRQGRNVTLWVLLSFFFGWIPTIVLLAVSGV